MPREFEVGTQPASFDGRSAFWANATRTRYGDKIMPVTTYKFNGHNGSWIYHEGTDWETGEDFCLYHMVCDCAGGVEGNSPQALVERSAMCESVIKILQKRAAFVDHTYHTGEILAVLRDEDQGDFEQPNKFHSFAVRTIANVLELDARHPSEWPANIIQGQHQTSILATMLQLHPEVVKWYGKLLEGEGIIDFDGETMSLTAGTLSEMGLSAA